MTDRAASLKLTITVPEETVVAYFAQLIEVGVYGHTPGAVAAYLIRRGLDDLLRAGVIARGRRVAPRGSAK